MITGPLMLYMGVPAQVSVATSSFMIFFTSSSTAAQYSIIGAIPWDYGLYVLVCFACVCFIYHISIAVLRLTSIISVSVLLSCSLLIVIPPGGTSYLVLDLVLWVSI